MKGEFFSVLIRSDTFWSETFLFVFLSISLIIISFALLKYAGERIKPTKTISINQSGAAAAVDFILTLPIFMLVLFLTIQFALIANASLHIHYAAYSAAHSARVYYFDTSTSAARALQLINLHNALTISQANKNLAETKALDAARMALISVGSPKNDLASIPDTGSDAWKGINTYLDTLSQQDGTSKADVFQRKASYAFDNSNVTLDVGLDLDLGQAIVGGITAKNIFQVTEWPVKADITFKYILALPLAGKIFGTKGNHGFYYRELNANVSIL